MKTKFKSFLSLSLLLSLTLTGCGNDNSSASSEQGSTPSTTSGDSSGTSLPSDDVSSDTSEEVEEEYVIKVTAPTGVEYSLNKTKAKKGEEVILTITSLASGYSINKITMNNRELSPKSDRTYSFTMPDESALIVINVTVSGEVTLAGDIAAILEKEGDIFVARNVKVNTTNKVAYFSYQVKGSDGNIISLDSRDLDETKCLADITFAYQNEYALEIASGATYDFYYDPSAQYPCYVVRTNVDYLPSDEDSLFTLFDGRYRSESTVNYDDLVEMKYSVTDRSDSTNPFKINMNFTRYENNVTYASVEDIYEEKTYHVYKNYDEENDLFTVVDNYPRSMGNNDKLLDTLNRYTTFSGQYDVIALDGDTTRSQMVRRDALQTLSNPAHTGYNLEREFMYAYRVGYSLDELSSYKIDISSTSNEDGFITTIDSFQEYDATSGTYTSEIHEGIIYSVTIGFTKSGKPTSLEYSEVTYAKDYWDFSNHKPYTGSENSGVKTKTINATYKYGNPKEGSPEFDCTPYFLSSIDSLIFYNSKTEKPTTDGKSYLHYDDKVTLNKTSDNDTLSTLKEFTYSPSTALDIWQYGPVASSNEDVIKKTVYDMSYVMSCVGIGDSTVTFGNYTKNGGIKYDLDINVSATQKFHSIYIYSTYGGYAGDTGGDDAYSATVVAGGTYSFLIAVTPSTAPVIYDAVSEYPDLLSIESHTDKLTINTSGATNITTTTKVRVRLTSDWFEDWVTTKYQMLTFTLIPRSVNPVDTTWGMIGYTSHVELGFTNEAYTGSYSSSFTSPLKGYISDDGYQDDGTSSGNLRVDFYYEYQGGKIVARLYKIAFSNNSEGWSTDPTDYTIDFYYDLENDHIGVFLAESVYDDYYEDFITSPIYGDVDDEGYITSYSGFERK